MEILKEYFEEKGYNVVALPKSNIKPLQLLSLENGYLSSLGSQVDVLFEEDSSPLPAIYKDMIIPDLKGQSEFSMQLDTGLNFLKGILATLKLGKVEAKAKFEDSDKIIFSFDNIVEDGIKGFLDLDNFISGAMPQVDRFRTYKEKLENSELYIITSVLKCNEFSVKIVNKNKENISSNLDIKGTVSTNAELNRSNDNSARISHKGEDSLVIAFKAVQIIYDAPKWFQFWDKKVAGFKIKAQVGMVMRFDDFPVKPLNLGENLADINEL